VIRHGASSILFALSICAAVAGCSSSKDNTTRLASTQPSLEAQLRMADQRCRALATHRPNPPGRLSGTTRMTMRDARAALDRARQPIPALWKNASDTEVLAVCEYDTTEASTTLPTTRCPNGQTVQIPPDPLGSATAYLVDSRGTRVSLPTRFLSSAALPSVNPKDLCATMPSP
jgi:hypothetical protein